MNYLEDAHAVIMKRKDDFLTQEKKKIDVLHKYLEDKYQQLVINYEDSIAKDAQKISDGIEHFKIALDRSEEFDDEI